MAPVIKKVLIIDDDKTIHAVLKIIFEKAGYEVFTALDAMQGVMFAKQLKPDLIVLDIMMPAGGGFSVYKNLQMMAASFRVPFLIYSAADKALIIGKIQESSSVIILNKSANIEQILEAASKLTSG